MKKILVLQFRTDKSLGHERECFDKVLKESEIRYINIFGNDDLSVKLENFDGLIISGSGQFDITKLEGLQKSRIEKIAPLIIKAVEIDFPTLGICFGHQLIAHLNGGEVVRDEKQAESGSVEVNLNHKGQAAKIFKNISKSFYAIEGHKESVGKLPRNAIQLASSKKCNNQSYKIGKNIFCVQFHPEFELDDMMFRLSLYPEYLKNKSIEEVRKEFEEVPHAIKVLKNFEDLV